VQFEATLEVSVVLLDSLEVTFVVLSIGNNGSIGSTGTVQLVALESLAPKVEFVQIEVLFISEPLPDANVVLLLSPPSSSLGKAPSFKIGILSSISLNLKTGAAAAADELFEELSPSVVLFATSVELSTVVLFTIVELSAVVLFMTVVLSALVELSVELSDATG